MKEYKWILKKRVSHLYFSRLPTVHAIGFYFRFWGWRGANFLVKLQIWRMSDLIYRPEEEVLAELEKFKSHVIECAAKPWELRKVFYPCVSSVQTSYCRCCVCSIRFQILVLSSCSILFFLLCATTTNIRHRLSLSLSPSLPLTLSLYHL